MKRLAIAAAMVTFAFPVLADTCNDEKAEALSQEVFVLIDKDASKADQIEGYMDEIEKEYGGEPSEAQVCEALQKLIDRIKADG